MFVIFGVVASAVFASTAVAGAYGVGPALALVTAAVPGAIFLPLPTFIACGAIGLWLRLKPLLAKW